MSQQSRLLLGPLGPAVGKLHWDTATAAALLETQGRHFLECHCDDDSDEIQFLQSRNLGSRIGSSTRGLASSLRDLSLAGGCCTACQSAAATSRRKSVDSTGRNHQMPVWSVSHVTVEGDDHNGRCHGTLRVRCHSTTTTLRVRIAECDEVHIHPNMHDQGCKRFFR